jgi:hypothetical protein
MTVKKPVRKDRLFLLSVILRQAQDRSVISYQNDSAKYDFLCKFIAFSTV